MIALEIACGISVFKDESNEYCLYSFLALLNNSEYDLLGSTLYSLLSSFSSSKFGSVSITLDACNS